MNPIAYANSRKNANVQMVHWHNIHSSGQVCSWEGHDGENWMHGQTKDQKAHLPSGPERLGLLGPVKKG